MSFDPIAIAMAKPKKVELANYADENGMSVANQILYLLQTCMQSGKTQTTATVTGGDIPALCNVLVQNKDILIKIPYNGLIITTRETHYDHGSNDLHARSYIIPLDAGNGMTFVVVYLFPKGDSLQINLYLK